METNEKQRGNNRNPKSNNQKNREATINKERTIETRRKRQDHAEKINKNNNGEQWKHNDESMARQKE